jgi:hypothetical protein
VGDEWAGVVSPTNEGSLGCRSSSQRQNPSTFHIHVLPVLVVPV